MAIIGIDLGTTNSCVAVIKNNKPEIITDEGGRRTIPSIVSFLENEEKGTVEKICGHSAYQQMLINSQNTVYCVKRLIGHSFKSPVVSQLLPTLSYEVIPNQSNEGIEIKIPVENKTYSPEEISSFLLSELRIMAEKYLGEPVSSAVITVPAYFNNKQRQATKDAALIAGIDVLRIINEPTAAAIAYGFAKKIEDEQIFAVFDFGGGTFDITILEVSKGLYNVIATAGNTFLGGEDITNGLFEYFLQKLSEDYGIDDVDDPLIMQRLRDYAETTKKDLTTQSSLTVEIPYLKDLPNGEFIHFKTNVSREILENIAKPFVLKAIKTFKRTLAEIKMKPDDLNGIIMIGGQTRMPLIQQELGKLSPKLKILKDINPDETVAVGAAIQASILESQKREEDETVLLDVTPHNLGIAVADNMFYTLIPKNSTVPTSVDDIFVTSKDYQDTAKILLLQGNSKTASENELLGEFELSNLRKAPRGEVKIKITYEIDMNGIVTVQAMDMDTLQKQQITVSSTSNLSEQELNQKIMENSDFYMDIAEKSMIEEIYTNIENLIYSLEKMKNKIYQILSQNDIGLEEIDKMDSLIDSTKKYLKTEHPELEKLQILETNLVHLKINFTQLLSENEKD